MTNLSRLIIQFTGFIPHYMYLREQHELIRGLISCVITSSRVRALLLRVGYVGMTLLADAVGLLPFAVYLFVSQFIDLFLCLLICFFVSQFIFGLFVSLLIYLFICLLIY